MCLLTRRDAPIRHRPPGYENSTDRYPVLGSVDVSSENAVIRPVVVVGIENTQRRRDLAPEAVVADERAVAPRAGGIAKFRAFLRDELKPAIAARYRVTAESAIIGESLAGLFVLETFVDEPTLFVAYIGTTRKPRKRSRSSRAGSAFMRPQQ